MKIMNRKLLYGLALPLFALVLVSAGLITYYASFSQEIEVNQPIEVSGDTSQKIICEAGKTCSGGEISIYNDGTQEVSVNIQDSEEEGIEVTYYGKTTLTEKTVDFGKNNWEIPEEAGEVEVEYVIKGDNFNARVLNPVEGYELIYYKDNSERFNSPAEVILISEVSENLPYENDKNKEDYDYCEVEEDYSTCHGAKLWYVPTDAINEDKTLNWDKADEFYYETELKQYNSEGNIITYPGNTLTIYPEYSLDINLDESENPYSVITEINPII